MDRGRTGSFIASPRVRTGFATLALLLVTIAAPAMSESNRDQFVDIVARVDRGEFAAAESAIADSLQQPGISIESHSLLEFERERMRRILIDFPHDQSDIRASLGALIPDLRDEDIARWEQAGVLEHMVIDGRKRYFDRAVSNLFRLSPDATARRATPPRYTDGPMESPNAHHRAVHRAAVDSGSSSVAPRRVRVTQSLTVGADAVPAGEIVRAWIPYPRAIPGHQDDIRLTASAPKAHAIAPETAMQRTVYLEQPARAGEPTKFSISYELTISAQYHAIDPDKVVPTIPTAELAQHLGERAPHIVYTDALREFSRKVVGDEKNPYRIARKLFIAVDATPWAGAREYSTISNISDYALRAGHADCGQQTLLLMTLLRLNGIPARWQSGMVFSDGTYDNLHDWGQMYLAPYGWVPVDVTTGRLKGAPDIEWFYLGGLDAYRIVFNDDYGTQFIPSKQHFRSETVDSQRGEVEWKGGNLYFDQWDYSFEAKVLPELKPGA